MPDDPFLSDAERTAREISRQDEVMLERLAAVRSDSIRDRWVLGGIRPSEDPPVVSHPPESYRLPAKARKILAPTLLDEIHSILDEVRAANDELAGIRSTAATVLVAGDDLTHELRTRLRRWAEAYVAARLSRSNSRDDDDPVARFKRLYQELLPALEEIAVRPASAHHAYLGELTDYVPWLLFQGTWTDWFVSDASNGPLEHRWLVDAPTLEARHYCTEIARLYAWPSADDLRCVVRAARPRGVAAPGEDRAAVRSRLATLAAEIREMRPFVVADHNPEKCFAELAPGLTGTWFWGGSQQLGVVPVHEHERRRIEEGRARAFRTVVRVRHDGLLASEHAPWNDIEVVGAIEPDVLAVNLALVTALHAKLLDVFARIDLSAAFDRVRAEAAGDGGAAAPTQEALAASLGVVEAEDDPSRREKIRVPTLRLERFLAILERLGCEIRQGKGSEVVAFRPGGRIARIGRHTRNREVPSGLAQRVLHQVGVTLREWVGAVG